VLEQRERQAVLVAVERPVRLAAYVEALGGRLEIIADFGDERLAFTEPGNEAA
jgi:hypothetical protein